MHVQNFNFRPAFSADYQCSPAFTQNSSGAIPATTVDYQRFHKHHRMLTGTLWCDGPIMINIASVGSSHLKMLLGIHVGTEGNNIYVESGFD